MTYVHCRALGLYGSSMSPVCCAGRWFCCRLGEPVGYVSSRGSSWCCFKSWKNKTLKEARDEATRRHLEKAVFTSPHTSMHHQGTGQQKKAVKGLVQLRLTKLLIKRSRLHSCTDFCFSSSSDVLLNLTWETETTPLNRADGSVDVWIILAVNIFLHLKWWSEKRLIARSLHVRGKRENKRSDNENTH